VRGATNASHHSWSQQESCVKHGALFSYSTGLWNDPGPLIFVVDTCTHWTVLTDSTWTRSQQEAARVGTLCPLGPLDDFHNAGAVYCVAPQLFTAGRSVRQRWCVLLAHWAVKRHCVGWFRV
jgi:hypothetical protein